MIRKMSINKGSAIALAGLLAESIKTHRQEVRMFIVFYYPQEGKTTEGVTPSSLKLQRGDSHV
jgi:hypothetical protein